VEDYESAPIQSVIDMVDAAIGGISINAASAISSAITPIVSTCFGIYMILMMVNYMRGASSAPVWDVYLRAAGFAVIIGLGMNMGNYANYVVPMVQHMGNDLAQIVSGSVHETGIRAKPFQPITEMNG
jgi:type IV secretion system protein VirB6